MAMVASAFTTSTPKTIHNRGIKGGFLLLFMCFFLSCFKVAKSSCWFRLSVNSCHAPHQATAINTMSQLPTRPTEPDVLYKCRIELQSHMHIISVSAYAGGYGEWLGG